MFPILRLLSVASRQRLRRSITILLGIGLACGATVARSQPVPGDVFREYIWTNRGGDAGGSLRVGGRVGYDGSPIEWPYEVDLEHAVRAEVVFEKLLCHDGTRGFALQVNDQKWLEVPDPDTIPAPTWNYQSFSFPVVSLPLSHLQAGTGNTFSLRVSDEHPWDWPQHLIYGVHLRVYYDAQQKPHGTGKLTAPSAGSTLGESVDIEVELEVELDDPSGAVRQVDVLGLYEDVNWQGDGRYRQWQYHFLQGQLQHHLGTLTQAPYRFRWDTTWVPDQPESMQLAARITDDTGLIYFTPVVSDLSLRRPGVSVELCKPYDVPPKWVTRDGEKTEKFCVTGDLCQAVAAQLVWSSWSPGYMNGLYINEQKVVDTEGPRYACFHHRVTLTDIRCLQPGENQLKTGKTPLHDGKMVHGMEVNWPGIMVLIRYEDK